MMNTPTPFVGTSISQRSPALDLDTPDLEAEVWEEFHLTVGEPWDLVNAGRDWRRAKKPEEAKRVLEKALELIQRENILDVRLLSTTHTVLAAALRDLNELSQAIEHAELAIQASEQDLEFNKKDFYPYNVLGALYYALRDFAKGDEFFDAAQERGASLENKKRSLQNQMFVMPLGHAAFLAELLLEKDNQKYDWAQAFIGKPATEEDRNRKRVSKDDRQT